MTQLQATKYLTDVLTGGCAVNMICVYRSRTGRKRGYRLFVPNRSQRVEDITAFVCKAIEQTWNNVQDTYETSERTWNGSDDDAINLCNRLSDVLNIGLVPVVTL
jgi:hypothetical protein